MRAWNVKEKREVPEYQYKVEQELSKTMDRNTKKSTGAVVKSSASLTPGLMSSENKEKYGEYGEYNMVEYVYHVLRAGQ